MLTPELEQLIQYALADGVLTDKERAVLMKKAEAAGADLDEFEMILEAKLHEAKKAAAAAAPKASNKEGEVRKCPHCGARVRSFRTTCEECGYEFRNAEAVKSAAVLFEQIQNLETEKTRELALHESNKNKQLEALAKIQTGDSKKRIKDRDDLVEKLKGTERAIKKRFNEAKASLIKLYAVPNTNQDLLEFLTMAAAAACRNDGDVEEEEEAWLQKTDQIYQKLLIVAADDQETLKKATGVIASLIKRLPLKHKSFTRVPQAQRERIAAELQIQEQIRREAYHSNLRAGLISPLTVVMIIGVFLFFFLYFSLPDQIPNEEVEKSAYDTYFFKGFFMFCIVLAEFAGVFLYFHKAAKATKDETLL